MTRDLTRAFLVGCPRSGTTLLQSMLAAHPSLTSFPETHFFNYYVVEGWRERLTDLRHRELREWMSNYFERLDQPEWQSAFARWYPLRRKYARRLLQALDELASQRNVAAWLEKTPSHLERIELIKRHVPQAKFIHIVRNGADVVASLHAVTHNHPDRWGGELTLDECIDRWIRSIQLTEQYRGSPDHAIVSYEQLVADPEPRLQRLFEHLGLDPDVSVLDRYAEAAPSFIKEGEDWKAPTTSELQDRTGKRFQSRFQPHEQQYVLDRLDRAVDGWPVSGDDVQTPPESLQTSTEASSMESFFRYSDPATPAERAYWWYETFRFERWRHGRPPLPRDLHQIACSLEPSVQEPIFVVGTPRSGTTFLGSCLEAIPDISYHYEPVAAKIATRYIAEKRWSFDEARDWIDRLFRWLMRFDLASDRRFAEKMPRHAFILDFLYEVYPDATGIHLVRDGRDVAASYVEQPWLSTESLSESNWEPGGYRYGPFPRFWVEPERRTEFASTSDLHRCIWSWRRHVEAARGAGNDRDGDRYVEIRYETLVREPERTAERLADLLDLSSEGRRHIREEAQQASPSSIGRWKRDFDERQLETIRSEASELLDELGYDE
jgi:LPS sulfotransferase NodH